MSIVIRPDDSKAIYGALFIEFLIYAVFYIFSHIKDVEINQLNKKRLYGNFLLKFLFKYFLLENYEKGKEQEEANKGIGLE